MADSTKRPGIDDDTGTGVGVLERPKEEIKFPPNYIVFVHNDPFTPREFVVDVLMLHFRKTREQAIKVMMAAHTVGMGAAGHYTKEIAETKASQANDYCRAEGRLLTFSFQQE